LTDTNKIFNYSGVLGIPLPDWPRLALLQECLRAPPEVISEWISIFITSDNK